MQGVVVGSYRVLGKISEGGMGAVYRAEHALIGKPAAVKVLLPALSMNHDVVNRFFNEARATTQIKHPGIVEIFDFGYLPTGQAYLVMEFLEGEPLSRRLLARGRLHEGEAAALIRAIASALAAAHAKGIVHRDLKPDNIFVVPDPESPLGVRTKILDFGIAKLTDVGLAGSTTKTGAVMGTPTYMSPEQCRGTGKVDHRADIYSIGCMLYEMVAGRPPFVNDGAGELIGSHLYVEPDPVTAHAQISPPFAALVMQLLRKKPEERVQTAVELAQRLVDLAAQHGWVTPSASDPIGRFSMPQVSPAVSAKPLVTPPIHDPGPSIPTPTTLTGAASQSHPIPGKSKTPLILGLGGLLAVAAGIVMFLAVSSGGGDDSSKTTDEPTPASAPAAAPAPPAETKPVETKPAETKPVETKPVETKPAETTPVETTPAESKAVETKSAETKPAETKPAETKPAETKPAETKPAETKPAETTPPETKPQVPRKPLPRKLEPNKPPPKPTKPKRSLIETDL